MRLQQDFIFTDLNLIIQKRIIRKKIIRKISRKNIPQVPCYTVRADCKAIEDIPGYEKIATISSKNNNQQEKI